MRELLALNIYFRNYAGQILLGILFVLLSNIAGIYVPIIVRFGIDEAMFNASLAGGLGGKSLINTLVITSLGFGVLIILASLVKGIFMYLMRQYIVVVSRHIEFDLKNDIYGHYQRLDTSFYRKNFTGDMMARIGEDVSNVRMYTGPAVMYFANILFVFITVILQMFRVNAELSWYVLLPLPMLSYSIYKVSVIINHRTTDIQTQLSKITTFAQETFAGIRVIKSFAGEKHFTAAFETEGKEYRRLNLRLAFVNSLFFPLMMLLIGLSTLMVLYIGGKAAIRGNFSAGNIAEFVIYLNMLIWPVASLGWTSALVQKAAASQKRINAFLQTPVYEETAQTATELVFEHEIRFENVTFTYPGANNPALENISFSLKKGEILGITGRTGSGKSTIVQLLMRLYEPDSGVIYVDNVAINTISLKVYRQFAAYVPQDVFLFSDTIKENIAFGRNSGESTAEDIEKVAALAALDLDIDGMPNGLNTILGERGVTLSGGQKQRVSIARALHRQSELYVFDDCLSAVDANTETAIIQNFKYSLAGKTAIIISHRVAPLMFAQNIIVLKNGKIAELGAPTELLQGETAFSKLAARQANTA